MKILYFFVAILLMSLAHLVRVYRWELFVNAYEKPNRKNLILALNAGFMLNHILPYKLGELARAWISGRKMKNGKSLAFSTVIMDRFLDIVTVGFIFVLLSTISQDEAMWETSFFYILMAVCLLAAAFIAYAARSVAKKGIRLVASIFNTRIEAAIMEFSWALIWNFKDMFQKISKKKMLLTTVGMWACYLASYFVFARFLQMEGMDVELVDIFVTLFAQSGLKGTINSGYPTFMTLYMMLPILILVVGALMMKDVDESQENDSYLRLLPQVEEKERVEFLDSYFSNKNRGYVANYLKINQEISVIRDYSAGSNATTMLGTDGEKTFFRKYALGEEGEKLYQQILWLENNKDKLALPEIMKQEKTDVYCYYDMPYNTNAVSAFEYVHSMPIEKSWEIIKRALNSLETSIYHVDNRPADKETISKYVEGKVLKNLDKIKNAKRIKNLQQYDTIFINGIEYKNLPYFEKYLTEEYLQDVFKEDTYAVIHGDLTIENIICRRDDAGKDDFYIIDPNTGNVHDSPNLDYGKLLQSIHGGYEFLMSTKHVNVSENQINFLFTRSSAYIELHKLLREYFQTNFGENRTRSIYFHEIIHWLRLMPYKIEKDGKRALLFYAGLIIVMNDVIEMYGDK